jgi:hypothetical protein
MRSCLEHAVLKKFDRMGCYLLHPVTFAAVAGIAFENNLTIRVMYDSSGQHSLLETLSSFKKRVYLFTTIPGIVRQE